MLQKAHGCANEGGNSPEYKKFTDKAIEFSQNVSDKQAEIDTNLKKQKEMEILPVKMEDAEELLSIYAPYVRDTAISFEYVVPSLSEFRDRIRNVSSILPYIKAVEAGEILGYAYAGKFKNRKAYDWSVEVTAYVREDSRRSGIGRQLYHALEDSLKRIGILNMNACIALSKEDDKHLSNDSYYFHEKNGILRNTPDTEVFGVFL